jgi:MFS transporter, DHA2 family, multidrug resistance protein
MSDAAPSFVPSPTAEATGASKWLIAASVMLGTFLSVMDATVVNVALPHMMGSFGTDLLTITWVSTAYSIAEIIMITMASWWTALLGRKRLFLASMALFIFGSVLAGTARTLHQMIFYRVLQGIGGGSLMPCSQAIARETFPPSEQGMAMAIYSMGVILAPAIGPVIGGYLVDQYGWQWVFYVNVPFCIVGMLMVAAFVYDPPYLKRGVQRIDWTGIVLLMVALTAIQIVLERGEEVDWFASNWIVFGAIVGVVGVIALLVWELTRAEPIIDFKLFRNKLLSAGCAIGSATGFALFGTSFVLPQFTENLLEFPAYQAGLVLMPRALAMFAVMPIVGRLYNYVSPRIMVSSGILLLCYAYWRLAHFDLYVGFWSFAPILIMCGIGMGVSMVTLNTVALSTIPRSQMTSASSLSTLTRRESGNVSYAVLATVLARRTQYHRSVLVSNVSQLNQSLMQVDQGYSATLMRYGYNPNAVGKRDLAMVDAMVNRHANLMAYNDVSFMVIPILLASLALMFLLPKHGYVEDWPEEQSH